MRPVSFGRSQPLAWNSASNQDTAHLLKHGLVLIDVGVLDHIIIGDGEPLSMVEHGWIVA
jgi:DNA repair protein RadC